VAEQSPGNDAGVVEDEQVTGAQQPGQVAEGTVADRCRCPHQMHHARGSPVGQGLLRNEFLGQLVIEVRDPHAPDYFT
jgi:hypothetical protein